MANTKETTKWKPQLIDALDNVYIGIYIIITVFLVAMAFASFFYVGKDLSRIFESENAMLVILLALKDLFVAIIIVELLQTVVVFIREEQVDIRMILGAGLTAMVRKGSRVWSRGSRSNRDGHCGGADSSINPGDSHVHKIYLRKNRSRTSLTNRISFWCNAV